MTNKKEKEREKEITPDVTFAETYDARLMKRLWVFFQPHRRLLIVSLLSYPLVSAFLLLQPYLIKLAIDEHLVPKNPDGFLFIIASLVLVIALEFGARFGQTLVTQLLGQRVTRDLRGTLFDKLQNVDLAYVEKNPVGRLMTRVTNDVESLSETFSAGAISILGDIVTLVGIVVMMLILDVKLTLYAFATMPLLALFISMMRKRAREAFRRVRSLLARMNAYLNEAISGMSVVQVFNQEQRMYSDFEDINRAYREANFSAIRYDAITYAVVEAISTVAIALVLLLGLQLFQSGAVEVGLFVAFVEYLRRFFQPITELSTKYTLLQSAMASAERCVDLLDQNPSVVDPENPSPLLPFSDALVFRDVFFRYQEKGQPVLNGLSFSVRRGEKIAIVGPTGAGKSTIVKLVARFYDPTSGSIQIDGQDIRNCTREALRQKLAVVLQDPHLFDASIHDNIAFGLAEVSRTVLEDAARRTCADRIIEKREQGWEAPVGERGGRLSAGEKQLIAFARALALNPEILILDEATSSVDPETEGLIQQGLEALLADRTAVIIAHRLSTIRKADRILVIAGGKVAESGSHDELLAHNGLYRKLYELQFQEADLTGSSTASPSPMASFPDSELELVSS